MRLAVDGSGRGPCLDPSPSPIPPPPPLAAAAAACLPQLFSMSMCSNLLRFRSIIPKLLLMFTVAWIHQPYPERYVKTSASVASKQGPRMVGPTVQHSHVDFLLAASGNRMNQ
ncbi:hypothetical protein MUK42_13821 [Musa troglodytarum]|uniref:Uncharacterized protein n=1 Tax=Musa troglodytarum TaxID=320322 RepID=A0A9E7I8E5_9LILI|nr:hypothetical protein MUK42_13821 [Musa troglodytarum]